MNLVIYIITVQNNKKTKFVDCCYRKFVKPSDEFDIEFKIRDLWNKTQLKFVKGSGHISAAVKVMHNNGLITNGL